MIERGKGENEAEIRDQLVYAFRGCPNKIKMLVSENRPIMPSE